MSAIFDLDGHLAAIVAGDPEAFGLWVAGAEPPLRRSLRGFALRLDTEAVLQETLLRAWQVAPRVKDDGEPNGLLRLSLRIARNLAISELRRQRVQPVEIEELTRAAERDGADCEGAHPDPHLREIIARCREALPGRPALALRTRLESSGAEPDPTLAQRIGMRLNTFLQNVTRARRLLASCLRKHGVDLELELS